jgi:CRISPR-associated protein Cas2
MFIVFAYDIPDDKRRTRLFKTLCGYGTPRQESVFECDLSGAQYSHMHKAIKRLIVPSEDNVRIYELCGECIHRVKIIGGEALALIPEVFVVWKDKTLTPNKIASHKGKKGARQPGANRKRLKRKSSRDRI